MNHIARFALTLLVLHGSAAAQIVDTVTPQAASPGRLVTIDGTNLQFTMCVRFRAFVGGFVGERIIEAPVLTVTDDRVTALVPTMGSFIPPGEAQAGEPMGEVSTLDFFGLQSNVQPFYFFEGTGDFLENAGAATTPSSGESSVISFSLPNFPPTPGNAVFTPLLQHAAPGSQAALFFGRPAATPLPLFGGELAVYPIAVAVPAPPVRANGQTSVTFPIPPLPVVQGRSFVMQWGYIDGVPSVQLSDALRIRY